MQKVPERSISNQAAAHSAKHCKGLKIEVAKKKPAISHAEVASSSSDSKKEKHKTKSHQPDSQPDYQVLPPTSSQVSSCMSPCHSGHDKKKTAAATPKKSHSSSKDSGEKCSLNHKLPSKKHKAHKSDKHQKKKKHSLPKDREVPTAHHPYNSVNFVDLSRPLHLILLVKCSAPLSLHL